jgi:tyrosyl-tRNA synthetase
MTARLGDPTGRERTRPMLTEAEVTHNAAVLAASLAQLLPEARLHFNHAFFAKMDLASFITKMPGRVTVDRMLSRDGFRRRDSPIALHELLVPLMQGWDSVVLSTEVEIGGHDQLFNFQLARKLQRAEGQAAQVCLMVPLLVGLDGRKMSKSFDNCIFLDESPREVFGKTMSISDDTMAQWLPLLWSGGALPEHPMARKLALAEDVVCQLFGPEEGARQRAEFRQRDPARPVTATVLLDAVIALRAASRGAARRLIRGGGVRVNGERLTDSNAVLTPGDQIWIGPRDTGVVR